MEKFPDPGFKPLIIIPTYKERKNLEKLLPLLLEKEEKFWILVVDDSSPDGTGEWLKKLKEKEKRIELLERPRKMGMGTAYRDGFRWALKGDFDPIFEMDADLSHSPEYLPLFLEKIKEADIVIGSRYIKGGKVKGCSWGRFLLSRGASLFLRIFILPGVKDPTSGFRCFRRKVLESFPFPQFKSQGFAFQVETLFWAHRKGFKIVEIPIVFHPRKEGKSKLSLSIILEVFLTPFRLRK